MDELKQLIELVKSLPDTAVLVLGGYLFFKLAVVGSVYATIRFVVAQIVEWRRIASRGIISLDGAINKRVITRDSSHTRLLEQLDRICDAASAGSSPFIHHADVEWLRDAIDAKKAADDAARRLAKGKS